MEKKKGIQLSQAFGAVLTLVLVAILVIIAIVIFVSLGDSFAGTSSDSVTNESVTNAAFVTGEGSVSLGGTSNCSSAAFALTSDIINGTENQVINSGNYPLSSTGVLTNLTDEFPSTWLVDYTWTWGSEACTASENMTGEFSNYTSLIGLVGTIIFLGLVIGVLVAAFAFGGRREV